MKVFRIYGEGNRQTAGGIAVARRMGQHLSDDEVAQARADSLRRFSKARANGLTAAAAAEAVDVPLSTLYRWHKLYESGGEIGLENGSRRRHRCRDTRHRCVASARRRWSRG